MGWLADRALDARIGMATKELLWDMEAASELRQAMVLAVAHILRVDIFGGPGLPHEILESPELFGRGALAQYYWNLETTRNHAVAQKEALKKSLPPLGLAVPQFVADHALNTQRALELWMVTIGCAVNAKVRPDVVRVWGLLAHSGASLGKAIDELVKIEALNQAISGQAEAGAAFASIDRNVWLNSCRFLPPFLFGESGVR